MTCNQFSDLLDQYLEGSLAPEQAAECERHLETCGECRLLLEIRKDCRQLDEGFEVPASFSASWRQAIREQEESYMTDKPKEPRRLKFATSVKRKMAIAASIVFVFGGTWLVSQFRPEAANTAIRETATGMPSYSARSYDSAPAAGAPMMMDGLGYEMAESAPQEAMSNESTEALMPQKIIRTIKLSLSTRAFDEDLEKLNAALEQYKGYVEYSDIAADRGNRRYANFTLRIPKDNLDSFLDQVKGVGQTVSMTESQEDVSERYSDTATRLQTQTTKMERLIDLLSKAVYVEDILQIEREIADTQYQIDRLTGSLRGMDSKVDYSTVSLYMTEEVVTVSPTDPTLAERVRLAVSDAWAMTVDFLEDFVVLLTVTLPYLIVLIVVILIIRRIIRRKKK